jgi:hypothetical protein
MRALFLDSHESHSSIQHDGQYGEWGSEHWSLALVHQSWELGSRSMEHGAWSFWGGGGTYLGT